MALVAAGGAMILALGGCGQSGPLYLPKESSPSASASPSASEPAPGSVAPAAAAAGRPGAFRTAPVRPATG